MFSSLLKLFKFAFKKLTKLSRPYFSLEENNLKFKIDSEYFFKYPISNIDTKTRHDAYVLDAYTLKTQDVFIEYIHTYTDVTWNGQALSFFISLLKSQLNPKTFELVEQEEYSKYEFRTYKIDNSYFLNIIYIYEMSKEIFIIDKKSDLYEKLLQNFKKSYVYNFEKNENLTLDFNFSLVKSNALRSYFTISST